MAMGQSLIAPVQFSPFGSVIKINSFRCVNQDGVTCIARHQELRNHMALGLRSADWPSIIITSGFASFQQVTTACSISPEIKSFNVVSKINHIRRLVANPFDQYKSFQL